jgi:hypothetical protein
MGLDHAAEFPTVVAEHTHNHTATETGLRMGGATSGSATMPSAAVTSAMPLDMSSAMKFPPLLVITLCTMAHPVHTSGSVTAHVYRSLLDVMNIHTKVEHTAMAPTLAATPHRYAGNILMTAAAISTTLCDVVCASVNQILLRTISNFQIFKFSNFEITEGVINTRNSIPNSMCLTLRRGDWEAMDSVARREITEADQYYFEEVIPVLGFAGEIDDYDLCLLKTVFTHPDIYPDVFGALKSLRETGDVLSAEELLDMLGNEHDNTGTYMDGSGSVSSILDLRAILKQYMAYDMLFVWDRSELSRWCYEILCDPSGIYQLNPEIRFIDSDGTKQVFLCINQSRMKRVLKGNCLHTIYAVFERCRKSKWQSAFLQCAHEYI